MTVEALLMLLLTVVTARVHRLECVPSHSFTIAQLKKVLNDNNK